MMWKTIRKTVVGTHDLPHGNDLAHPMGLPHVRVALRKNQNYVMKSSNHAVSTNTARSIYHKQSGIIESFGERI